MSKKNTRNIDEWPSPKIRKNKKKGRRWKMEKISGSKFLSRKFILAIVSALVVFLNSAFDFGLNQAEILTIVGSLLSFIITEGIADIKKR